MYICHCCRVTDHTIRDAIADGAETMEELRGVCAAGSRCGACWAALEEMLASGGDADTVKAYPGLGGSR